MDIKDKRSITEEIPLPPPKVAKGQKKKLKRSGVVILPIVITVSLFIIALIITACCLVHIYTKDVTIEVGSKPDYSHITSNNFLNTFCSIETDLAAVDTAKPSEKEISLKFFGFIEASSKLYIVDSVLPEVTPRNVLVTQGTELMADMFVCEIIDKTDVAVEFKDSVDTSEAFADKTVRLIATDEGGNKLEFKAKLTVLDVSDAFAFEYGISVDEIRNKILSLIPLMKDMDLSHVKECGEFTVTSQSEDTLFSAQISISDRIAPTAQINSFDILLGDSVTEEQMVTNIADHSEVTVEFLTFADFEKAGEHSVQIRLTDAYGNFTEYTSYIRIHDINTEVEAEIGSTNDVISGLIFNDEWSEGSLTYTTNNVTYGWGLGEHEVVLCGKYNNLSVSVRTVDTTPPELYLKEAAYLVGEKANINDFIVESRDATKVTYSFKNEPDSSAEGTFDLTVVATDTSGNVTEQTTKVTFFCDVTPPVISGQADISLLSGETCDFSIGVSANDDIWGEVDVEFDPSSVDLNTPGTYSLTYTAKDGSGNVAEATVTVEVREPLRVCLDVENIMQKPRLKNGCEVVSLAIALKYAGYVIDPVELYDGFMPKSPLKNGDPWTSYIGDAKGSGFGCYAPCVIETGNAYLKSVGATKTLTDVSGWEMSYYESLIDGGTPVIMWGTVGMNCNPKVCWKDTIDGKEVLWHSYSHCLVLIGYTDYTYIFCDPLEGVVEYSKEDVEESFDINFKQACVVW